MAQDAESPGHGGSGEGHHWHTSCLELLRTAPEQVLDLFRFNCLPSKSVFPSRLGRQLVHWLICNPAFFRLGLGAIFAAFETGEETRHGRFSASAEGLEPTRTRRTWTG